MAKQNLLLVDADLRSVRVLEVSLRKAGYNVASAGNGKDALAMLELSRPDLVLCDTRLPVMDGFELIQEMRGRPELAGIPLMILSSDVSVETKVRGLELGIEDYLTKPIYIKELLARVNIVLQRKRREGIERLEHGHKRKFSGSLSDMGVVDLLQAIDHSKKSGVLYLTSGRFEGAIYFCNGAPVDAAVGRLRGSRAIYRTLLWSDGTFEIDFREIDREDHVQTSMQAVLMEGLRRVDEWGRLLEQLPNLDTVFDVSDTQLMARLAEIPDQINSVLREFDGQRSLWEIVDACDADDLETLNAVSKLYFEGLLYNTGRNPGDAGLMELEPEQGPEIDMSLPHISSGPPVITHTLAPAWGSVPSADGSPTELVDDTLQLNIPATPKLPDGLRISPSEAPKRRKGRKRKKRSAQSLPAAAEAREPAQPPAEEVRVVDESVAEITPSTIAPPPEDAENAAIVQAEQGDAPTVSAPGTSTPPQLPRSRPATVIGGTTTPPGLPRRSQAAAHDSPTLDLSPIRSFGTQPPLQGSGRPPLSAAAPARAEAALKSTAPPPLSSQAAPPGNAQAFNSDEETTERQGSIPPRPAESYIPRNAASPPPLPYVSKPPSTGFGSHRGVTSPGFAAAPADEETIAAAAAAISEAETAPPPLAAEVDEARSSHRVGSPSEASGTDPESGAQRPSASDARAEAPYPASAPARDFEAAILASIAPPPKADAESDASVTSTPPQEHTVTAGWPSAGSGPGDEASAMTPSAMQARGEQASPLVAAADRSSAHAPDLSAPAQATASTQPGADRTGAQPVAAASEEREESASPALDDSAAEPRDLSAPPLAAASSPPAVREDAEDAAAFDEASGAAAQARGLSAPPLAAASEPAAAREDADTFDEASDVIAARPRELSAPPLAAASTPAAADDAAAFDETSGAAAQVRDLSAPPLAAASEPAAADDAAAFDETSGVAAAQARGLSAPPLAAASAPPAVREDAEDAAAFDETSGVAAAQARGFSVPPLAAASEHAAAREDADDSAAFDEASDDVAARPRELSAPPLAAASAPAAADDAAAFDETSGVAAAQARGLSAPPLATASAPPAEREDAEDAAAFDEASGVAAAQARGFSVPPLSAASEHAAAREDADDSATFDEASDDVAARPRGFSAPPLAAASAPAAADDAAAFDETSGVAAAQARGLSAPPLATASAPPAEREDAEDAAAFDEASGVAAAQARSFRAPPLAAASVAPARAGVDESAGDEMSEATSAQARSFGAPPFAAASTPAAARQGADDASAFDEATGAAAAPLAAVSTPAAARGGAEDSAAFDGASDVAAARPRDFSAPPLAVASVPAGADDSAAFDEASRARPLAAASTPAGAPERADESAIDDGSGFAAAEARDFSPPALAAASAPPPAREGAEDSAAFDDSSGVAATQARDFVAPPLAAPSVLPEGREGAGASAASPLERGEGAEQGEAIDASAMPGIALDSLAPLGSAVPANDVGVPKPEEDFSDLDLAAAAARLGERGAPPPLPTARSRSVAPRTRTSPPPLPSSRARADGESGPALATVSLPPPSAARMSSTLPESEDSHTEPGGYVAIKPDLVDETDDQSARIRAPVHRTEVPPPFEPHATPPSATNAVAEDAGEAQTPRAVELATSSEPPRISTAASAVQPDSPERSMASDRAVSEHREEPDSIAAKVREAAADARSDSASLSAQARAAARKTSDPPVSGRPLSSQRPPKTSNVISFVPRKRAEDAAASGKPAPPGEAQGVWTSTSGTADAANTSAPQAKRRVSRWVQAGGAAATVALAAGLFALRARDTPPQGSLIKAVPEAVETKPVTPPPAAADAKQQALGELEALDQQAQTAPEAPKPSTASAAQTAPGLGAAQQASAEPAAQTAQQPANAPSEAAPANTPAEAAQKPASEQPATPEQQAAPQQTDKPAQAPSDAPASAAQTLAKGLSLEKRGKKQDAINLYAKAVEEGRASSQLMSRMAFLYLNQGKNALAEASAKRAADADETNSEAWIVLGAALDAQGKKPAAEQAYRSCAQKGQGQYVTECKRMLR